MKNQMRIAQAEIEGVHTVLTAYVDFRGHRILCQTPIPGILASTTPAMATLMYGSLDMGSDISVKTEAATLMTAVGEKLGLSESQLAQSPWSEAAKAAAASERQMRLAMAAEDPFNGGGDVDESDDAALGNTIIVNKEGEQEPVVQDGVAYVTHVGPLEGKLIKGTDSRTYVLEMIRLNARDPNYVSKEMGGTDLIDSAALAQVGAQNELPMAYLLRPELKMTFLGTKRAKIRKEIIDKSAALGQEMMDKEEAEKKDALTATATATATEGEVKEEKEEEKKEVAE
jgi:hypothetical protein